MAHSAFVLRTKKQESRWTDFVRRALDEQDRTDQLVASIRAAR